MRTKTPETGLHINRSTPLAALPELIRVDEFMQWYGCGRWTAYDLIRRGALPTMRFGRRIRIPRAALEKLVDNTTKTQAQ